MESRRSKVAILQVLKEALQWRNELNLGFESNALQRAIQTVTEQLEYLLTYPEKFALCEEMEACVAQNTYF